MSLIHDIVFGKKIILNSKHSVEEILSRIEDRTCEPVRFKVYAASKSYVGYITDNNFSIRLQHKYRTAFSPKVLGLVETNGTGSSTLLHIQVNPISLTFLFVGIFAMIGLAIALLSMSYVDELIDIIMLAPLIIFLLILLLAVLEVQHEMNSIEYNLSQLFEANKN